jgi:alkylated DNA repair dioxygenase AlkB
MTDLFEQTAGSAPGIDMPGAELRYYPAFLSQERSDYYYRALLQQTPWREEEVFVWGKWHMQPRLIAWYGDEGSDYTYSGRSLKPLPWTPILRELCGLVQAQGVGRYNSVLLNLYRDNDDSMGWHSDNEPELGEVPNIASLSLGETRDFLFKNRSDKSLDIRRIALPHGSLLVMSGATQKNWLHAIGKERKPCGARINLTFRYVFPASSRRRTL